MKKAQKLLSNILKECSGFESKVYREVLSIPLGELRTYKQIAKNVACPKAYRAVGQALKKNPLPFIIPCHRVVKSNSDIGGYIYGRKLKKELIQLEKDIRQRLKI